MNLPSPFSSPLVAILFCFRRTVLVQGDPRRIRCGYEDSDLGNVDLILFVQPRLLGYGVDARHHIHHSFDDATEVGIGFVGVLLLLRTWTVILGVVLD